MPNKNLLMPSLSRVAPGSVAMLEYPLGPTYMSTVFSVTGTGVAVGDIGRINLKINGQVVMTWKNLQRLIDMNAYWNHTSDSINEFEVHFFRRELHDLVTRRAPGLGTKGVQSMVLEMQIDAGAPADIAIAAHSVYDPAEQPLGVFMKVTEYPFSSNVSGDVEVDKLLKGPWYPAIHLFKADISKVEVKVDEGQGPVVWVDSTKSVLERNQKDASPVVRVPQTAKATHIDFITDGDVYKALKTEKATDFRLRMTLDTSGAFDVVTETMDTLKG